MSRRHARQGFGCRLGDPRMGVVERATQGRRGRGGTLSQEAQGGGRVASHGPIGARQRAFEGRPPLIPIRGLRLGFAAAGREGRAEEGRGERPLQAAMCGRAEAKCGEIAFSEFFATRPADQVFSEIVGHADTELGGPRGSFQSTLWSLVLRAQHPDGEERRRALETLIRTYWKPLYVFVRRKGNGVEA